MFVKITHPEIEETIVTGVPAEAARAMVFNLNKTEAKASILASLTDDEKGLFTVDYKTLKKNSQILLIRSRLQ